MYSNFDQRLKNRYQKRLFGFNTLTLFSVCKKRDASELEPPVSGSQAKKPRLVFTDLQRRTLQAIFKVSPDKKTILT